LINSFPTRRPRITVMADTKVESFVLNILADLVVSLLIKCNRLVSQTELASGDDSSDLN
jgi:hypothetical protein